MILCKFSFFGVRGENHAIYRYKTWNNRSDHVFRDLDLLCVAHDDSFARIGQWRIHDGYDAVPHHSVSSGGLMGLVTSFWLYFRRKQLCDAQVCQMQGKRWNVTVLAFSTVLMSVVTYVDFFLVSL